MDWALDSIARFANLPSTASPYISPYGALRTQTFPGKSVSRRIGNDKTTVKMAGEEKSTLQGSTRRIFVVDAFTDKPFGGNPAAVCLVGAKVS